MITKIDIVEREKNTAKFRILCFASKYDLFKQIPNKPMKNSRYHQNVTAFTSNNTTGQNNADANDLVTVTYQ